MDVIETLNAPSPKDNLNPPSLQESLNLKISKETFKP